MKRHNYTEYSKNLNLVYYTESDKGNRFVLKNKATLKPKKKVITHTVKVIIYLQAVKYTHHYV